MARVFFPTTSLNRFGVRDTNQQATLGGVTRFPAEPTPRSAMTPTGPLLGGVDGLGYITAFQERSDGPGFVMPRTPIRIVNFAPPVAPVSAPPPAPPPIVQSSGGGGATASVPPPQYIYAGASTPAPAPVSSQNSPTPIATLPAPAAPGAVLVSSGGGTQTPATAPVSAPSSSGLVDGIAAWLGGSTSLLNYNVPNAVLAGVVVLGFAWLSSGSSGRKR